MSEPTKTCKCCGVPLVRNQTEAAQSYTRRMTCSILCGARYRRGIITNPGVVSIPCAMAAIESALRGWRSVA